MKKHLYYPQFLNDEIEAQRNIGINSGIEFLKCCDEVHVFGEITAGMLEEINVAKENNIKIYYK